MTLVKTAIYMRPAGKTKFRIPINPEKIKVGSDAKFMTYDTITLGTIKIHRGREPLEVSWSGKFPGEAKKGQPYVSTWTKPETLVKTIRNCVNNGTIVTLSITGTGISGQFYVSSFDGEYSGGLGDFDYDLKLVEYREIKIYTVKEKKSTSKKKTSSRKTTQAKTATQAKTTTYTVKSGDTLWQIAASKLGKGSRYTEIYTLNKNVIEKAAKTHGKSSSNNGWWIYPGTKLTIPKA